MESPTKNKRKASSSPVSVPPTRRAVRRDRIRAELIEIGLELFKLKGFDETTVNDIVAAAGMSPRTFFRYFKTKDDLVMDWIEGQGEFALPILEARPATERPFDAMKATFLALADLHDQQADLTQLRTHLIFDTPSLSGRFHEEHAKWEGIFMQALKRKAMTKAQSYVLRVQVSIAITAFIVAIRSWSEDSHSETLRLWVEKAFQAVTVVEFSK